MLTPSHSSHSQSENVTLIGLLGLPGLLYHTRYASDCLLYNLIISVRTCRQKAGETRLGGAKFRMCFYYFHQINISPNMHTYRQTYVHLNELNCIYPLQTFSQMRPSWVTYEWISCLSMYACVRLCMSVCPTFSQTPTDYLNMRTHM